MAVTQGANLTKKSQYTQLPATPVVDAVCDAVPEVQQLDHEQVVFQQRRPADFHTTVRIESGGVKGVGGFVRVQLHQNLVR